MAGQSSEAESVEWQRVNAMIAHDVAEAVEVQLRLHCEISVSDLMGSRGRGGRGQGG